MSNNLVFHILCLGMSRLLAISSVKLSIRMDTFVKGGNEMWKMPAKEHEYSA